jgi:hydrogenase maturation protease
MKIAVFCVGNKLELDDGLGCAVYDELSQGYEFDEDVDLFDVGCMSLDLIDCVRTYDFIVTVDAVDGSGEEVGTVFRYAPEDMAGRSFGSQSLHDLRLSDLFENAALLGYSAEGICFGMQVENISPADLTIGLTPRVNERLPYLVDCVLAELVRQGAHIVSKRTGEVVAPGYTHEPVV